MDSIEKSKMTIAALGAFGIHMVGKKLGASTPQSFGAAMIFAYGVYNSKALTDFLIAKREEDIKNRATPAVMDPVVRPNDGITIGTSIGTGMPSQPKPRPSDTEPVHYDGHYTLRGFGAAGVFG
jgi:hypothetical protein